MNARKAVGAPSDPWARPWARIWTVFGAGIAAAFLVGKAPAALPVLRADLNLSLFDAGLVVSMFSLVAAGGGVLFGLVSDHFGQLRVAVAGFGLALAAGLAGAGADTSAALIAWRAAEGIGFFLVSVSLPPLLLRLASAPIRQTVMGLWGAYLPAGAAIIMLAGGGAIGLIGWRGLWVALSVLFVPVVFALWWAAPKMPSHRAGDEHAQATVRRRLTAVTHAPGPLLLTATFGCYSSQYLAVTAFVPLILVERAGWSVPAAAAAGALVMLANITGNIAAGILLDRGLPRVRLLQAAALALASGSSLLMIEGLPVALRIAGAVLFSAFGGLIPGSLFAGVARHAPSPRHVATVNGLMLQGVALGQLLGPAMTTWIVQRAGTWTAALIYLLPMAALSLLAATALGRLEQAQDRPATRAEISPQTSSK
jgi:MFS family permease